MRIRRNKRTALALLLAFVAIGGVSAVIFSNTLSNSVNLYAVYPIELSWDSGTGPSGLAFAVVPITDTILAENLDTVAHSIELIFQMTVPAGADATDFYVMHHTTAMTFSDIGGGVFQAVYDVGGVSGAEVKSIPFEWGFYSDSVLGDYSLDIYANSY